LIPAEEVREHDEHEGRVQKDPCIGLEVPPRGQGLPKEPKEGASTPAFPVFMLGLSPHVNASPCEFAPLMNLGRCRTMPSPGSRAPPLRHLAAYLLPLVNEVSTRKKVGHMIYIMERRRRED
jgi:hypothetical protein